MGVSHLNPSLFKERSEYFAYKVNSPRYDDY